MKVWLFPLLFSVLLISSCAPSYNNQVVTDRVENYDANLKVFRDLEHEYLILLSNLERYPKDEYLLKEKKRLMAELEQQRQIIMQSRKELDKAISDWEHAITLEQKEADNLKDVLNRAKEGRVKDRPEWEGFE